MEKLWLSEILEEDNIDVLKEAKESNIFIQSYAGSGKTFYIETDILSKKGNNLLFTDNLMLKDKALLSDNIKFCDSKGKFLINNELKRSFGRPDAEVMCYAEGVYKFNKGDFNFEDYDIIILDEFHNLFLYSTYNRSKESQDAYKKFIVACLQKYPKTKIIYMTATPYYCNQWLNKYYEENNIDLGMYTKTISYLNDDRIRKYISNNKLQMGLGQTKSIIMKHYDDILNGYKVLIYTTYITKQIELVNLLNQIQGIHSIALWSLNADYYPMDEKQLKVRNYLLLYGKLIPPYNVLITNDAYLTGYNIENNSEDKTFQISIVNSTNVTKQIQHTNRIRHNRQYEYYLTNQSVSLDIDIPIELLDKWLFKEQIELYLDDMGYVDKWNRPMTVNKFLNNIQQFGYSVEKKLKKFDGKQLTVYYIHKI